MKENALNPVDVVRAVIELQGVRLAETRYGEITVEAGRLRAGLAQLAQRLTFFDEPSAYPLVLRNLRHES